MICLGVSATEQNSVDAQMTFFSPDTDVLVFDHSQLWSTAKEHLHLHGIKCPADRAIMDSSGPDRAKALPGLHAFSGETTLDILLG